MKLLTSPEIALLQIPQEKLQPKPSILSQLFGKKQKNKAPHRWLPHCLHQFLSTFSISDVHCVTAHTTQWIKAGYPYRVAHKKGQKTNEYICVVEHFDHQERLIWKTLHRWWLQDNEVHFAVSFQASLLTFDIVLSDLVADFLELKLFVADEYLLFYQEVLNNHQDLAGNHSFGFGDENNEIKFKLEKRIRKILDL